MVILEHAGFLSFIPQGMYTVCFYGAERLLLCEECEKLRGECPLEGTSPLCEAVSSKPQPAESGRGEVIPRSNFLHLFLLVAIPCQEKGEVPPERDFSRPLLLVVIHCQKNWKEKYSLEGSSPLSF